MGKDKYVMKIIGGLGNQMFQYAFIKSLSIRTGTDYLLDFSAFKSYALREPTLRDLSIDDKSVPEDVLQGIERWIIPFLQFINRRVLFGLFSKRDVFEEKEGCPCVFDEEFYNPSSTGYIIGYFQSEKYFINIRDKLLKEFLPKSGFSSGYKIMLDQIKDQKFTSVSVHIRRGDYISDPAAATVLGGCCPLSYYENSIEMLSESYSNIKLFIFSDDLSWVRNNIDTPLPKVIVDSTDPAMPCEDIWLMANCDHNIIANSSFSWWGAWLNENPEKIVVSPKRWFAKEDIRYDDIYCEGWIKV